MGTRIEAVATTRSRWHRGPFARGARRLSDAAARACLERAGHSASELDLLINAGLYKEHSMAEPALASIIQEDIGANPGGELPRRREREQGASRSSSHRLQHQHGTFSFDVMNGGCGVHSAIHLADAFLGAGTAQLGLVVAGDADPSPGTSRGFPFSAVGGAILLKHEGATDSNDNDNNNGNTDSFKRFELHTFAEHSDLFEVRLGWDPDRAHNILDVREAPSFARHCLEHATDVTIAFLEHANLHASDIDLLVASQYPVPFAYDLARAIGLPFERVPRVRADRQRAHTAGPITALESAVDSGSFDRATRVLFVTVGAGITVGAALYEKAPAANHHS